VSPQNILVGADGITRLVDFGIAKAAGRLHSTRDSSVKGKYAYMAPEQVRGEPVSRLTDTYAAAIVFWELLTGERLFVGKTDAETIHKCLVARVQPPSLFAPELGPKIDEILRKGLSREPARRYQTAREMALDIEACVPAIRPSEVGAWVARIAGDALAARAMVLAEIERGETDTLARREGTPPTGHSASWVINGSQQPVTARTGRREATPHSARTIEPHSQTPTQLRSRTTAILSVLLVAALLVSGAVTFAARRATPGLSTPAATKTTPEVSPPAAAPIVATPTPTSTAAVPTATAPSGPPTVPISSLPEAAAKPITSLSPPLRAQSHTSAPRPSHPAKRSACDPPYSIDSEGRQIFKPECM
jgi:eukaryotic-like serine/threonine-protein kinase